MSWEYKVRPVTRWVVTRYEEDKGSSVICEMDNEDYANYVAEGLARAEREVAIERVFGSNRTDSRNVCGAASAVDQLPSPCGIGTRLP